MAQTKKTGANGQLLGSKLVNTSKNVLFLGWTGLQQYFKVNREVIIANEHKNNAEMASQVGAKYFKPPQVQGKGSCEKLTLICIRYLGKKNEDQKSYPKVSP